MSSTALIDKLLDRINTNNQTIQNTQGFVKSYSIFDNKQICAILTQYLDFKTIMNLDESKICDNDNFINLKHTFQAYLHEWSIRQDNYGWPYKEYDETFVMLDGDGYAKYTLLKIIKSGLSDIDHYLPYISVCEINEHTKDEVKCEYDAKNNTWNFQYGECIKGGKYDVVDEMDDPMYDEYSPHSTKFLKFDPNDIANIIKECPYPIQKKIDRVFKLLNISKECKARLGVHNMVDQWYLSLVRREYAGGDQEWDQFFGIFGLLNDGVIPTQWKSSGDEQFDCFIVFQVHIHEAMP